MLLAMKGHQVATFPFQEARELRMPGEVVRMAARVTEAPLLAHFPLDDRD
ncbi:hypothetical protein [Hyphomicrobium sp.]|nr:hypothetical protein [Hyphomicrobium sp.]